MFTKDGSLDFHGNPAPRSSTGLWKASSFILANQMLVSITYYGVYNNLARYLTDVFHESNAGAANNVNYWVGNSSLTALIGAFLSDTYWGRYWTCTVFLFLYLLAMVLLTLSPALPALQPDTHATTGQAAFLYFSLYLGALAAGSYQTCNSSLGADQFDEEEPSEKLKEATYFNWYYLSMTLGSLIASTLILYVQENVSWSWGFGVCTIAMAVATLVFLLGTRYYRHHRPSGNPLTRICQVFSACIHKWNVQLPADSSLLFELPDKQTIKGSRNLVHTDSLVFLDKAAVITDSHFDPMYQDADPWKLCTVTRVEEVKCILRMLPIFAVSIIYSIVYSQMATLFLEQGGTMNRRLGHREIPAGSLSVFESLSVILWTTVYERLLVPLLQRITKREKGMSELQRIGTGFVIAMLAMVVAALVELKRLSVARTHGLLDSSDPLPMSVFWLVPQYLLIGASEVFTFIGLLEFFYDQSPDGVRALGSSIQLTSLALGNYSSSVIVTVVNRVSGRGGRTSWIPDNLNRGHIDYFYWMLATITGIGFLVFLLCARWYKYITTVCPPQMNGTPSRKNDVVAWPQP